MTIILFFFTFFFDHIIKKSVKASMEAVDVFVQRPASVLACMKSIQMTITPSKLTNYYSEILRLKWRKKLDFTCYGLIIMCFNLTKQTRD